MSITDELREYAEDLGWLDTSSKEARERIEAIADRIDAEHEKAIASVMNDALCYANDKDMAEFGWIRLPKDADGVPWHIGDVTESGQTVEAMGLNRHGWHFVGTVNEIDPAIRHHHAPTVEDVLREFAVEVCGESALTIRSGVVEEYASRLRLAGES